MRRTKKDRLPARADERDRALYAKLRDYLVRMDDDVTCKTCQKRFEIPSHQTMVFLDERSSRSPQGSDIKVWCELCRIRIDAHEERTGVGGKTWIWRCRYLRDGVRKTSFGTCENTTV